MQEKEVNRREYRRKRRIKNQILSILSLMVVMVLIVSGIGCLIYLGGDYLLSKSNEEKQMEDNVDENGDADNDVDGDNDEGDDVDEELQAELDKLEEEEREREEQLEVFEELVSSHINNMTMEEKVAGLFVTTPEELTGVGVAVRAGNTTKEKLTEYPVGGMVYFGKNIKDKEQLQTMINNTVSFCKYPLFICVDEEGGTVSRIANAELDIENVGDMKEIGATGIVDNAATAGSTIGSYLAELGFNIDFAPVADVASVEDSEMEDRSFGADPNMVGDMVAAYIGGVQANGVSATAKHFPGIGSTTEDTHNGQVVIDKSLEELRSEEFIPFIKAIEAGVDLIMVGHVSVPHVIGDDTPSSLSSMMINEILRNELGYKGVVVTDALDMGSITDKYEAGEASVMAIQAGADILLMPEDFEVAYNAVLEAVESGKIPSERLDESLKRIYRVKFKSALMIE